MDIREATINDAESIDKVYLQSFDKAEAQIVSDFAIKLLSENSSEKIISLVAAENEEVVGHIAFSPVFLESTNKHLGYLLAPLAVSPAFQKRKIGSSLIDHGLASISSMGSSLVFVYGDPQYYSRFGFLTDNAANYIPPYTLKYPDGWQVQALNITELPVAGKITCVNALSNPDLW